MKTKISIGKQMTDIRESYMKEFIASVFDKERKQEWEFINFNIRLNAHRFHVTRKATPEHCFEVQFNDSDEWIKLGTAQCAAGFVAGLYMSEQIIASTTKGRGAK